MSQFNAIDIQQMGIADFKKHIASGAMTTKEVLDVLDARIEKRKLKKMSLIPGVVNYRNELAEAYETATGKAIAKVAAPVYPAKNSAIPSDPDQLADLIFSAVGATGVGKVITRLTARIAAA